MKHKTGTQRAFSLVLQLKKIFFRKRGGKERKHKGQKRLCLQRSQLTLERKKKKKNMFKVESHFPILMLPHNRPCAVKPVVAKKSKSNSRCLVCLGCLSKRAEATKMSLLFNHSGSYRIVVSLEPVIMVSPSYCKHSTDPVWPVMTLVHCSDGLSQI